MEVSVSVETAGLPSGDGVAAEVQKFRERALGQVEWIAMNLAAAFRVSTGELLGFAGKEPSVKPAVKERRLWRRVTAIDGLSKRDRAALVRTIDAFLSKAQLG